MSRIKMTPEEKVAAKQQREADKLTKLADAETQRLQLEFEWESIKDSKKIELMIFADEVNTESFKFDLYQTADDWGNKPVAIRFINIGFTYFLWGDETTFNLKESFHRSDYDRIKNDLTCLMEEIQTKNEIESAVLLEQIRKEELRKKTLAKLSDDEISALGLRK